MGFPDHAKRASLIDCNFIYVVEEDLSFFSNLLFLDVSENSLALSYFGGLSGLLELRMACNNISCINNLYGFDNLRTLDLSYNSLSEESVAALGAIATLKELDLCGNNMRMLPSDLAASSFVSLERLMLENNKFESSDVLTVLGCLPCLRHISLAYNFLSIVQEECASEDMFRFSLSLLVCVPFYFILCLM